MAFNIMVQFIQKLRLIWSAISWVFSVNSEIEYIQHELATMNAFLEEAEDVPERAKIKGQWIRRVTGLAYDVEDCFDEFKRRLLHPTDQEVISCFLQICILLRIWAGTCFLKTSTWFLRTSFFYRTLDVGTSFHSTGASFFLTSVELALALAFAGLALAFAEPTLASTILALASTALALAVLLGTCFLRTGTGIRFRGVGTSFHSTFARFLRTGVELGTSLLRTGVERGIPLLKTGSRLLRMGHAYFWLVVDIARIKASVKEASNTAQRFGFISMPSNAIPAAAAAGSLTQQLNAHFIQDDALVGIEKPMDELLNLLLDGDKAKTCVISVVGCGGLGKTTLVRKVLESQKLIDGGRFGRFGCRAWFVVSQSFQLIGFLKQVFLELSLDGFNQELRPDQLIRKIRNHLRDKRYVIVFDDVWTVDAWKVIKHVFTDNMKGSRVIVTTRDENVARTCCVPNYEHVYKLPTLSPQQSMGLFCKIVFDGRPCPNQLEDLSNKILEKCGGVPLVIATIGGVLASKPTRDVNVWKEMLHQLGPGIRNDPNLNRMMQIMALSYNALPYHLKRCFLYLSIFPEDYKINCKQLQALWIAEGLIGDHDNVTPEEAAESYLNEFVCRNMIQASEMSGRGRVKRCRVHDVMLEFIISKSAGQNVVTLSRALSQAEIRRLSLHPSDIPGFPFENTRSDRLRSFFMFGANKMPTQDSHKLLSSICNSRFLRVVELNEVCWLTDSHIHEIGKFLYHLKHLKFCNFGNYRIPESFGGLENLETLDARKSVITIPAAVFKLPKLRHLRGRNLYASQGLGSTKTLQTLDCLMLSGKGGEVQELRSLTHLRKLGVAGLRPEQGMDFCASISEMSSCLRSLKVGFDSRDNTMGYLDSSASPPVHLRSLELDGYLGRLPGWINMLQAVSKIVLIRSELQFDAIQALQKLPNLVTLHLLYKSYIGKELHFDGEGFGCLKTLYLDRIHSMESLAFGAGSMPSLQVLHFWKCLSLRDVGKFDRENLPRLNKVVLWMDDALVGIEKPRLNLLLDGDMAKTCVISWEGQL